MRRFSFRPALTLRGRRFRWLSGFEGKPFHPPLTDVVIGAYTIAVVMDVVSLLLGDRSPADELYRAATFAFLGGLLASVPTVVTGLSDWTDTEAGTQIRRTVNAHAWTMVSVTVLVVVNLVLRWGAAAQPAPPLHAALSLAALVLLTVGGTIGGSITYDYGFNVRNSTDHPVWHPSEEDVLPGDEGEQQSG